MVTASIESKRKVVKMTNDASMVTPDPISEALQVGVPAWPLQNTVAVNPFWNLRHRSFADVTTELPTILHESLYMPLEYYLRKFQEGEIKEDCISAALEAAKQRLASVPLNVDEFIQHSTSAKTYVRKIRTFAEYLDHSGGSQWSDIVTGEVSKYAAAYFDQSQALAKMPWKDEGFWNAWMKGQEFDRSMDAHGLGGFRQTVKEAIGRTPRDFVSHALEEIGLNKGDVAAQYLSRLLVTGFGWCSQFRYVEWQKSLGYQMTSKAETLDFLAVKLVYDLALMRSATAENSKVFREWVHSLNSMKPPQTSKVHDFELHRVWQTALEQSYQTRVVGAVNWQKSPPAKTRFQVAMCIDVRSEMIRRALEGASPDIETIGFAGFFGVPFDYQKIDEKHCGHRLPVLLTPAFVVKEQAKAGAESAVLAQTVVRSYFRNLRKTPLSSLLYVEFFGLIALAKVIGRTAACVLRGSDRQGVPSRFSDSNRGPVPALCHVGSDGHLDLQARVERAAAVLKHMGMTRGFARLVVIAGHGSHSTNNAFASALDCGACGGHAGDVNSRVLADLLNDSAVRDGLKGRGIEIPSTTHFLAAVHETVTDSIYPLDLDRVPKSHGADVAEFTKHAERAAGVARSERVSCRSSHMDPSAARRSENWSEVRPEWALAGNACFIVGPRYLTRGANFSSRSFLHDYNWREDTGFSTLELIMTAPMVVTNWINMQYYGSSVVPGTYGSGNKVLHNLVNESGVLEGNGGDLKVGLPWQSVHDGDKLVHDPLRLSVFITAPIDEIEKIVQKHAVVKQLLDNEWVLLVQIDDERQVFNRRAPGGLYTQV